VVTLTTQSGGLKTSDAKLREDMRQLRADMGLLGPVETQVATLTMNSGALKSSTAQLREEMVQLRVDISSLKFDHAQQSHAMQQLRDDVRRSSASSANHAPRAPPQRPIAVPINTASFNPGAAPFNPR
jgi:predicted  nucleic acid-binding Zn-ribbon protein